MPKLWERTIEAHRREVRDAILDAAAALASEQGVRSVTMSRIAGATGIGRATLYKYFPDVEAILLAWHDREINAHLRYLQEIRDRAGDPAERLEAVLEAYAVLSRGSHGDRDPDLVAFFHRSKHVPTAQRRVHDMVRTLIAEAARTGAVREDVPPDELAAYCLHALAAAGNLSSKAAVRRLVAVTLVGLRPGA